MNQNIRKFLKIFPTIIIVFFATTGTGCHNSDISPEEKEMREEVSGKMKNLRTKPNQEATALLSIKYKLDVNTIEKIIGEYLIETDFKYRNLNEINKSQRTKHDMEIYTGILDKSAYVELINQISTNYSLEPSTVSSILFDYKIWGLATEATETNSAKN